MAAFAGRSMATDMAKDLGIALWDLTDILSGCPSDTGGDVWRQLVRHSCDGTVDPKFVTPVEQQIPEYLASLSEADKREIWSQTETGQMNGADTTGWMIEDIEMDLETELLAELLEQAFREAEQQKRKRSRRRTTG
jgi:hypothetical protein